LVTAMARVKLRGADVDGGRVKVLAENVLTGDRRHTNSCYVTTSRWIERPPDGGRRSSPRQLTKAPYEPRREAPPREAGDGTPLDQGRGE